MVNVIEQMLKGPDTNRDYLRDLGLLQFMTQGDL